MDEWHQKIRPLTLRFHDCELEQEFFDDYFEKALRHVRVALLVGMLLYGIFGILDAFIIPDDKAAAWIIRYGMVIPLLVAVYASSYSRHFKAFMQPLLVVVILVTGFGIIAMLMLADPPGTYLYYAGLILVIMYAYSFLRLRFQYAAIASWVLVLAYELAAVLISQLPLSILVNNTFFLLSANLIGMFVAYQMESLIRSDFLKRKALGECEAQKHLLEKERILKDLHDGVGGMTTHIALLADTARKRSPEDMQQALVSIAEIAEDSLLEIRGFMRSLDRKDLTWEACAAELRSLGGTVLEPLGIAFDFRTIIENNCERPDTLAYLHLFKIYREAVTNIIKHAGATAVESSFIVGPKAVYLSIKDNGSGLVEPAAAGRGLRNMRLRAGEIGGMLTITATGGTQVCLELPFVERVSVAPGKSLRET
jgi:signal transduction histidine kinase